MITGISQFFGDRRGGVATTFGICFLPAILLTGAAIDYSRSATSWSNLQQATDATALSAAHTFLSASSTPASLRTYAQNYISGIMNGATVTSVVLTQNNTQICVYSSFTVPTVFMKIARITSVPVATNACSQVGATYEVALALDNSTSMSASAGGQSKMDALKVAAKQLVGILIPSGSTAPTTAISLVPFTSMVNVGTSRLAPFLDTTGVSSIHWQNFNRPSGTSFSPISKFDLFDAMTNASWAGCVEERPAPYVTTDTAAQASTPDSMFVPYFAPDEPGAVNNSSGYACYPASPDCGKAIPPYYFFNSYISDNGSPTTAGTCGTSTKYSAADNAATYNGQTNPYPGAGLTMVCKYKGTAVTAAPTAVGLPAGPGVMCTGKPLTPLNTNSTTLSNAIDAMAAYGSTNLVSGFMWAWRTISPTVNPFPTASIAAVGPQNPKSYGYGPPPNTKIIILMTDGVNSWTQQPYNTQLRSMYEAFGYYANGRLSSYSSSGVAGASSCSGTGTTSSNYRCQMDNATLEACKNAKTAGVVVYTVGFSVPNDPIDAAGTSLLTNCASSPSNYYPASDSDGIVAAFQQIAASIQNLRLSQ